MIKTWLHRLSATLLTLMLAVTVMAAPAMATEMSAYQRDMKLQPSNEGKENFVAVRPGGDITEQCKSYCLANESCVAIYFREDESRCFYYNSYLFSLKDAPGFNTRFKIWTR